MEAHSAHKIRALMGPMHLWSHKAQGPRVLEKGGEGHVENFLSEPRKVPIDTPEHSAVPSGHQQAQVPEPPELLCHVGTCRSDVLIDLTFYTSLGKQNPSHKNIPSQIHRKR